MNLPALSYKKPERVNHNELFKFYPNGERGFVKAVLDLEAINHMRLACGLETILEKSKIMYDATLFPGNNAKYADILLEYGEGSAMYVEVMDSSNPKWDGPHHEQYILKRYRLSKKYDRLETFVLSFDKYSESYLSDFNDDDTYAVIMNLFKDDSTTNYNFECENYSGKSVTNSGKNYEVSQEVVASLEKWSSILLESGRKKPKDGISYSYLPVVDGRNGTNVGRIEIKAMNKRKDNLGIKLCGSTYVKDEFKFIPENQEQIAIQLTENTKFNVTSSGASSDVVFWFNVSHLDYNRIDDINEAIDEFAKICKLI
jgi:hypothetical protein